MFYFNLSFTNPILWFYRDRLPSKNCNNVSSVKNWLAFSSWFFASCLMISHMIYFDNDKLQIYTYRGRREIITSFVIYKQCLRRTTAFENWENKQSFYLRLDLQCFCVHFHWITGQAAKLILSLLVDFRTCFQP